MSSLSNKNDIFLIIWNLNQGHIFYVDKTQNEKIIGVFRGFSCQSRVLSDLGFFGGFLIKKPGRRSTAGWQLCSHLVVKLDSKWDF